MKQKLNGILLIDDDEIANYISASVVKRVDCCESVVTVQSGRAALDYLTTAVNGVYPQSDLIFLDINMPGMNGWQFLEHYQKLNKSQQGKVIVVMLTSSVNPDDVEKARSINAVTEFKTKPMTEEMLKSILVENFGF